MGGGGPGPGRVSSFCRPTLKINTKCRRLLLCGLISLLFVFDGRRDKVSLSSQAGLEWEAALRGVGPELVISALPPLFRRGCPVLHTLVRRPGIQNNASGLEGGTKVNQREKHLLLIFKSHAYVCEVDGSQRRVIAGKELHNSGGPRPRLLQATPTHTWTFAEKILDMVTIV